jgi:hypothetical protein
MSANLTLGDVLPSNVKSNYSDDVLSVSVEAAVDFCMNGKQGDLTWDQATAAKEIYNLYLSEGGPDSDSDSAYWNQSPSTADAYWNSGGSSKSDAYWSGESDISENDAYWNK